MARFDESYERFEEHQCHSERDAQEIIRQTVAAYGGDNRTVQVLAVGERRYEELLGLRNELLNQLEELA